jgi:hypothetical protein
MVNVTKLILHTPKFDNRPFCFTNYDYVAGERQKEYYVLKKYLTNTLKMNLFGDII